LIREYYVVHRAASEFAGALFMDTGGALSWLGLQCAAATQLEAAAIVVVFLGLL